MQGKIEDIEIDALHRHDSGQNIDNVIVAANGYGQLEFTHESIPIDL